MPADDLAVARGQVDTSYSTPAAVTGAVFELLQAAGFTGGRVLEPGCGSGMFMATALAGLDVQWTGVELDPTSARIARLLNPDATIHTGKLEDTVLRDDHYDAVIGNVPFSGVRVIDKEGRGGALHNYFIRRSIDAVRPGGYVIVVTSRHTIDAENGLAAVLTAAGTAALVGAVRLPAGAFAESGTDVVTDVIAIRKNNATATLTAWPAPADAEAGEEVWDRYSGRFRRQMTDLRPRITEPEKAGAEITGPPAVSRYWEANPQHVAGRMLATGFSRSPLTVRSDDPAADIARAIGSLASVLVPFGTPADTADLSDVILADADGRKEGSFHIIDGAMHRVEGGQLTPIRAHKELAELVDLRDLAVRLLDAEADPWAPDDQIEPLRGDTRAAYEAYVRRFGHLNRGALVEGRVDEETGLPALSWRRPSMGGFRRDPDAPLVMALEVFDQETGEASPAPILLQRVNRRPQPVERVDTPEEALAVSLGETGQVDLHRIAGLLGLTDASAARAALGSLAFDDGGRIVAAV